MAVNYRQLKAIEQKNKQRILAANNEVTDAPGIYILYREEDGIKYAYVGQAKHLLTRLAQHLSGYQHIDLSLKKHGLYSKENVNGYKIFIDHCHESDLDQMERSWIKTMACKGYQLRNKTIGGQGAGKRGLDDQKAPKGYHDGLKQGYKNAQKFVRNLFDKHLNYSKKSDKPNKNQEKALEKFKEFLEWEDE
jgi:hypothetical protein